ncbi:MAG: hypothetical protein QXP36_00780 [Conexivisphaerales archaeon]
MRVDAFSWLIIFIATGVSDVDDLERLGRILAGADLSGKGPSGTYRLLGSLVLAMVRQDFASAYELAKRFLKAKAAGDPQMLATTFLSLMVDAEGELRALLFFHAMSALSISPRPALVEVALAVARDEVQNCNERCMAYRAAALSMLYALSREYSVYEEAWRAFERAGRYRPIAAAWLPIEDEADLSRVEGELSHVDKKAVKELLGISARKFMERARRRVALNAADLYFQTHLDTGDRKYLEMALAKLERIDAETARLLRGRMLAFAGRLEEAKREFAHVKKDGILAERAKVDAAVVDALLGKPAFVASAVEDAARVANYVIAALQGEKLDYVEERYMLDVLVNAVVDISLGRRPERLRLLGDYVPAKWLIESIISSTDKKDALRRLYFAFF